MTIELTRHTITVAGRRRTYWAAIPPKPWKGAMLCLHSKRNNGHRFGLATEGVRTARLGYLMLYPTSLRLDGAHAWALQGEQHEEEVAFLHALLDRYAGRALKWGIWGNSSGGWMTWVLAMRSPLPQIAWVAPGAANLPEGWVDRVRKVGLPLWHTHGTADTLSPFGGEPDLHHLGFRAALRALAGSVALEELGTESSAHGKTTTLFGAGDNLRGARINGGGHAWHAGPLWRMQDHIAEWAHLRGHW